MDPGSALRLPGMTSLFYLPFWAFSIAGSPYPTTNGRNFFGVKMVFCGAATGSVCG